MIVEAFILGIIIRFLRKKKFDTLSVSLKGLGLFFAAIVIKFFLFITGRFYLKDLSIYAAKYYYYLDVAFLFLVTAFLIYNFKLKYVSLLAIGSVMNLIATALNGYMPVTSNALYTTKNDNLIFTLENNLVFSHGINDTPKLKMFCDIIPINYFGYMGKVISLGDIVMAVGIFLIIGFWE